MDTENTTVLSGYRIPKHRRPTTPGEILLEEFIIPLKLTQQHVADQIGVPYQRLNGIVRGRRAVSQSTALRLAKFFGTTARFWLNLQTAVDLYETFRAEGSEIERIVPFQRDEAA